MTHENAIKLEEKIRNLCEKVKGTLCFFGTGNYCRKMLLWFEEHNLDKPVAICDNNKDNQEKNIDGIPVISFERALDTYENLKILITTITYGNEIAKQIQEKSSDSCFVNIASFFETPFEKKNRLYINSLRGLNEQKFSLLSPEDMPSKAKEIVTQKKEHRELYENNIDIHLDHCHPLIHGLNIDFWKKRENSCKQEDKYSLLEFMKLTNYSGVTKIGRNLEYLTRVEILKPRDDINPVLNISDFNAYLTKKNIHFIYVQIPNKLSTNKMYIPEGYYDYKNAKVDVYLKEMEQNDIHFLDYRKVMKDKDLDSLDYFFKTDTHWKPRLAFQAASAILEELTKIGFTFDKTKCDFNNYQCINYSDIFLGSYGRKTGILFSGLDDFELILPKYETSFTWMCNDKNFIKVGELEKSLLSPVQLNWDYFEVNPYGVYSLVHENHTIIKNELNKNLGKILILCDSFSNPLSTFLAPHFSELHFLDLRGKFNKKELFNIIDNINPDLVMMAHWVNALVSNPLCTDISPYRD